MYRSLVNKVVLITGASSGIGAAAAVEFARQGSKLSLTGRNKAGLQKTAVNCVKAAGADVKTLQVAADLQNDGDIKRIVEETMDTFGEIDVLINNAGMGKLMSMTDITMEDYDEVFRVNTRAPVLLTQLCTPYLKESKGNVINVSSICSDVPIPLYGAYCMTKAALDMYSEIMSLEFGNARVRVNSILPGHVVTEALNKMGINAEELTMAIQTMTACYPGNKMGTLKDVTSLMTFLASEDAAFINGARIRLDGGISNTSALSEQALYNPNKA